MRHMKYSTRIPLERIRPNYSRYIEYYFASFPWPRSVFERSHCELIALVCSPWAAVACCARAREISLRFPVTSSRDFFVYLTAKLTWRQKCVRRIRLAYRRVVASTLSFTPSGKYPTRFPLLHSICDPIFRTRITFASSRDVKTLHW